MANTTALANQVNDVVALLRQKRPPALSDSIAEGSSLSRNGELVAKCEQASKLRFQLAIKSG